MQQRKKLHTVAHREREEASAKKCGTIKILCPLKTFITIQSKML
jgi:hypothetical protein